MAQARMGMSRFFLFIVLSLRGHYSDRRHIPVPSSLCIEHSTTRQAPHAVRELPT